MRKSSNDRNLLIGILALQLHLITQPQLITAIQAWMLSKSVPIEDSLLQHKAVTENEKWFLTALAQQHLTLHKNSAEESLAALSSISSVRKRLDDAELEQTLSMVS